MSNAASGKVCVVCGESCEDRPRVKDPKGRYFCRACYDKALERKKRQREEKSKTADEGESPKGGTGSEPDAMPASPRAGGALGADDWDRPLTDEFDDDDEDDDDDGIADSDDSDEAGVALMPVETSSEQISDSDATPASTGGVCPNCGEDFPLAAIICVNCGYNTTTGHTVEANVGGTVVAKEDVPTNTIWPSVIGILSIIIGAGLAGLSVWGLVLIYLGDADATTVEGIDIDPKWNLMISSVLSVPFIALMCWHGFAGFGLLQRREWGYRQMLLWAKAVIAIVAIFWILLAGLLGVLAFMAGAVMELILLLIASAIGVGVYLAWPIFLVLWLGRERIEAEVAEWE